MLPPVVFLRRRSHHKIVVARSASKLPLPTVIITTLALLSTAAPRADAASGYQASLRNDLVMDDASYLALTSCIDCSAFNRLPGRDPCSHLPEDCGQCRPGFAAQQLSGNRRAEICSRIPARVVSNKIDDGAATLKNMTQAFRQATLSSMHAALIAVCVLFILVCALSMIIASKSPFCHRPYAQAAVVGLAAAGADHPESGRLNGRFNGGVENDVDEEWQGQTVLSSESGNVHGGRTYSVPASSAYSSMTTLDNFPPLPPNPPTSTYQSALAYFNSEESQNYRPNHMNEFIPLNEIARSHRYVSAAPLVGASSAGRGQYFGINTASDQPNDSQQNFPSPTSEAQSFNLNFEEAVVAALPNAVPFNADASVGVGTQPYDHSLLRDDSVSHDELFNPNDTSFQQMRVGHLNDSVDSVILFEPFHSAVLDETRDDVVSFADTDPSDWAPVPSSRGGNRSHRLSEVSDVADVLASATIADVVDGVPPPRPFQFPPTPDTTDDDAARGSSAPLMAPDATDDDHGSSDEGSSDEGSSSSSSASSDSFFAENEARHFSSSTSNTANGPGPSGAAGSRRRRREEEEEEILVRASVRVKVRRARQEDHDVY